jgi:predicted Zn-dependent protease
MLRSVLMSACLLLAACTTYEVPVAETGQTGTVRPVASGGASRGRVDFSRVAARIEPVAEAFCREEAPDAAAGYCDFRIVFEADPDTPPNAFQTNGQDGRPVVVVTASLLGEMQSDDEIAFVLSHEAAHHIAQHIPKQQASQALGAAVAGGLAAAIGGDYASGQAIQDAVDFGAFVGGRAYSQRYELEADWLGAFITARAGYDPERGADIFGRPTLQSGGGPVLLSTHPASPQRLDLVSAAAREIERQRAAGLTPRPQYAQR